MNCVHGVRIDHPCPDCDYDTRLATSGQAPRYQQMCDGCGIAILPSVTLCFNCRNSASTTGAKA